jgi:hypothetical protein
MFEQVIRYNLAWDSLLLLNRKAVYEKRKLFQTIFNDTLIFTTINS